VNGRSKAIRAILWLAAFVAVTAAMVAIRDRLDRIYVTLAYLLVVQLASAQVGRAVGVTLAVLSFLAVNFFFLPSYGTLIVADPLDWLVLLAFLITSVVSAQLLYRARALGAERERLSAAAKRAESLEHSNRMKDEKLAMVSHDQRTPHTTNKGHSHENAAKYSPQGTPIDVGARRVGDELQFWVADRGPGIDDEDRNRVFEPFYRRRDSNDDVGGAGLGLSIAKGIAEAQGGTLTFMPREGGGSVFTLAVPAIDLTGSGASTDDL
jgi:K+-sensing histidine kinase KdpD